MARSGLTDSINNKIEKKVPNQLRCINGQVIEKLAMKMCPLTVISMKVSILWPYLPRKLKNWVGLFLILMDIVLCISTIIFAIEKIYESKLDHVTVVELCIQFHTFVLHAYITYFTIFNKQGYLMVQQILESTIIDWSQSSSEEVKFLQTYFDTSHIITYVAGTLMCGSYLLYGTLPVLCPLIANFILPGNHTYEKKLSLHLELFINEEHHFFSNFIITILAGFLILISLLGVSVYYVTCSFYAVGRFRYISFKLQKMSELSGQKNILTDKDHDLVYNNICQLIQHHQYCMNLVVMINYLCNDIFLAAFICLILGGSISGTLIAVEFRKDPNIAIKMVFIYVLFIEFLVVFSFITQKIYDASGEIYYECYSTEWYKFSAKNRKMLKIIMLRASQPSYMTIGPNVVFNFETSGNIIRLSLSYITALISIIQLKS